MEEKKKKAKLEKKPKTKRGSEENLFIDQGNKSTKFAGKQQPGKGLIETASECTITALSCIVSTEKHSMF